MNNESKKKASILRNNAVQTIIASLLCIVIGLLIGYVVLLIINPAGAAGAITAIMKNYFYYPSQTAMLKYMGTTLVKASALLDVFPVRICLLTKWDLFNIGAAGQYVVGAGASLYFALKFGMPWYVCMIAAIVIAALVGGVSGALKAYFNVNEVISCIMLNWISLYVVNMLLTQVKSESTPYTVDLSSGNKSALLPNCGLDEYLFRKQICIHRSYYFCGNGNYCMGTSGKNQIWF